MFPPGVESQTSCTNVTIVSDGRLEDEETFCLTLVSSDPDVTVGPTVVTCIVITDIDGNTYNLGEPNKQFNTAHVHWKYDYSNSVSIILSKLRM